MTFMAYAHFVHARYLQYPGFTFKEATKTDTSSHSSNYFVPHDTIVNVKKVSTKTTTAIDVIGTNFHLYLII